MDEPGDVIEEAPRIAPEGCASASVYQRVLGDDFAALDPRLQRYFGPIAVGSLGVGRGVYDRAGSSLAVLRPVLAVMARPHVLFPEAGRDVPFTVTNASGRDGNRTPGTAALRVGSRISSSVATIGSDTVPL